MTPPERRKPRTGSVYQRKDGRWAAATNVGPRGARVKKVAYRATREAAERALAEMAVPYKTDSERFWDKVELGDGCWLWTSAARADTRRGYFRVDARWVIAPRFAYADKVGPIADGMFVLHRCDNPQCVRPDHLWLGTQADNMADASAKGRL